MFLLVVEFNSTQEDNILSYEWYLGDSKTVKLLTKRTVSISVEVPPYAQARKTGHLGSSNSKYYKRMEYYRHTADAATYATERAFEEGSMDVSIFSSRDATGVFKLMERISRPSNTLPGMSSGDRLKKANRLNLHQSRICVRVPRIKLRESLAGFFKLQRIHGDHSTIRFHPACFHEHRGKEYFTHPCV
ncbi:hypothetical protein CRM22_004170 [Opisthorchis felineus]|uniref:Uncharacterized protein n=1 Tax=Opisthorchis felineus TaxID=147828 RepID=A0A4V3SFJ0_OPIFE|nr:hypothetical protein CRM22_004170 [Opisthorchis felineus]